ncbi:MAG TPA: UDP-3-O-(3-hydroxymyristoyl)glucosamine N-acyltransferase [Thermoanaerobaculia bacterium]|nr:UDP-3-O-(3-hydroxymyristoyl)glucosamine N-acyltransferase [Thermoanaerobaculia bacterium]
MAGLCAGDIADFLGGEYSGDRTVEIGRVRPLPEAGEGDLTFLANPKFTALVMQTSAAAVLVRRDLPESSGRFIRVDNPYEAFARVVQRWFAAFPLPEGISPKADVSATARIGRDVRIGAFVRIGDDAVIGDGVTIFEGCVIGAGSSIGEGTMLHANVTLYHRSQIGRRCVIHSGAVIGSDGFGFAMIEGVHHKIPQIGIVRIEDDVEIGAGSTIDRATLGETVIGAGTKIDNLVQVGHNVRLGRGCILVSQVGIAGSTEIGDGCVFGGQAGVAGHLKLGAGVLVAAKSAVMKSVSRPGEIAGIPARPLREYLRHEAWLRRLPKRMQRRGVGPLNEQET